jgi:ketosteroid isomerase-like protein
MKTRSLIALVVFAFGFPVSVFAQQNDTVGLPMRQEIEAIDAQLDDAINNNDPAIVATFFTEDAVLMLPVAFASERSGIFSGREAIKGWFTEKFTEYHLTESKGTLNEIDGIDNGIWAVGKWTHTVNTHPIVAYRAIYFIPIERTYKIRKMFVEF